MLLLFVGRKNTRGCVSIACPEYQSVTISKPASNNTDKHIRRGSLPFFATAIAIVGSGTAVAERPGGFGLDTPPNEMDELVVTATRLATQRGRIASSVSVITREEIQRRQFRSVTDALRTVPGVHVVRTGGPGQQTSVFMRGANSNHTLVLIDGIEVSDPSSPNGAVDFSNLWLDNVERIEVVRGPQSTLYGSDAIGGVIQIFTRRGEGELHGAAEIEGGSDNTFNQKANAAGATDQVDYSFGVTRIDTDGDSVTPSRLRDGVSAEDDNYENWTASARAGIAVSNSVQMNFFGRYIDSDTKLDPELATSFGGTTEDRDAKLSQTTWLLRGEATAQLMDGLWEMTLASSYTDYNRNNRNDRQMPSETLTRTNFDGDKLKFEIKNDFYVADEHVLTLGLETEKENMDSGGFSDFGGFVVGEESNADTRNSAVYTQDQFSYGDSLFGTVGLRYDDNQDYGSEVTYRFAPVYLYRRTGTRFKGSAGTGFKSPTLFQTDGFTPNNFGSFYRGNPDLDAEKSFGWEAGFEQELWGSRMNFGLTWFESKIDDLAQVVFDASFNSTYENIDEADIKGAEAFIHVQPFKPVLGRINYTYTDAEDNKTNDKLLRRPKHKFDVDLEIRATSRATVTLALNVVSDYNDISRRSGGVIKGDDYAVANLAAEYRLDKKWRLFGRVENLTDEHYEPADGFQESDRGAFAGVELRL